MFFFDLAGGGSVLAYRKVEEDGYEIQSSDYVLSVDNGISDWNITLPSPADITGKVYIIKRFDDSSTGQILISSQTGLVQAKTGIFSATVSILTGWGSYDDKMMFMSNGTNWEFIK